MKRRPFTPLPSFTAAAALAAAITLGLAACGPGSGGSGDGESALARFGATGAPLCSSDIGNALDCPVLGSGNPSGTTMVFYSDIGSGNNVAVRVDGNALQLSARCLGLQFDGHWGIAAHNDARFFGTYTGPSAPQPALASLTVGAGANNQELFVLLRDFEGRVLLGPVLVRRVSAPVANPSACPA